MFFDEPTRYSGGGGKTPAPAALQGCLLQPQRGHARPAGPVFPPSCSGSRAEARRAPPPSEASRRRGLRLAHRPVPRGRARRGVRRRLTGPLDLQWPGQRLLLPGGVPDEGAGPGRALHHLHHPPAQRQALRAVRPGTRAPSAHGGVFTVVFRKTLEPSVAKVAGVGVGRGRKGWPRASPWDRCVAPVSGGSLTLLRLHCLPCYNGRTLVLLNYFICIISCFINFGFLYREQKKKKKNPKV